MREIKFRAWDGQFKNMYYGSLSQDRWYSLTGFLDVSSGGIEGLEVMQFTGLKDKNGTEIYEGDILRIPAVDDWENINFNCFEVFFHDGDANSDYNIGYSISRMHCIGSVCGGYTPSFNPKTVSKMIVIGNIHQNHELLK